MESMVVHNTYHSGQTTAVQFKNKYHFGWGSSFIKNYILNAIYFNCFVPGHCKGKCNSKGGINKHTVARQALNGEKLTSAWDWYVYLSINVVDIMSKTAHALHSPEQ